jgi:hypothetical protein
MSKFLTLRRMMLVVAALALFAWLKPTWTSSVYAGDLDPAALVYTLPKDIKWVDNSNGGETAVVLGDPAKAGLYIILTKWHPHHMGRPHFHPNDRYITVLSGTWWVGTGAKYSPETTTPLPPGSFVKHIGKQIHYDGTKEEEVVLEILGEGPATSTPAEVK